MKYRIPIPTQEELSKLFEYRDGRLYSLYSTTNRKKGCAVGRLNQYGYRSVKLHGRSYYEHRLIWVLLNGDIGEFDVDHINGVRDDNRIENMRLVTRVGNNRNLRAAKRNSKTGLLGASFSKAAKKYVAQIRDGSRYRVIGYFATAEEAHKAYLEEKREIHETCTI
jgi:hypothetical protein